MVSGTLLQTFFFPVIGLGVILANGSYESKTMGFRTVMSRAYGTVRRHDVLCIGESDKWSVSDGEQLDGCSGSKG